MAGIHKVGPNVVEYHYNEPTLNEDGTPLDDLAATRLYYQIPGQSAVMARSVAASAPTGGGQRTETLTVPVTAPATVSFWVTAVDEVPNEKLATPILTAALEPAAMASWIAVDNFDSYTPAADLNGLNGGSGWSEPWVFDGGGPITVQAAPTGGQGGNAAASQSGNAATTYHRNCAPVNAGMFRWRARTTVLLNNNFLFKFRTPAGANVAQVGFTSAGTILIFTTGGGSQVLSSYLANTWYTIDLEFDVAAQPDKYRVRVNEGAWSAWIATMNPYTEISMFRVSDSATNAHVFYFDDIRPTAAVDVTPPAVPSPLTVLSAQWS